MKLATCIEVLAEEEVAEFRELIGGGDDIAARSTHCGLSGVALPRHTQEDRAQRLEHVVHRSL